MSYTRNNRIICDECGLFCRPFDEYTPFGCSSYDPPEPLEPLHICKKCWKDYKKKWVCAFKKAIKENKKIMMGDYLKSNAEIEVAKKLKLVYVGSNGIGVLGSKKNYVEAYQYIPLKEYKRLNKLPYWGWCDICGKKRMGGYCSDKNCEKSFGYKKEQPICNEINISEIPF